MNDFERENGRENEENGGEYPSRGVTGITGATEPETKEKPRLTETCSKCGDEIEPYWFKHHHCEAD